MGRSRRLRIMVGEHYSGYFLTMCSNRSDGGTHTRTREDGILSEMEPVIGYDGHDVVGRAPARLCIVVASRYEYAKMRCREAVGFGSCLFWGSLRGDFPVFRDACTGDGSFRFAWRCCLAKRSVKGPALDTGRTGPQPGAGSVFGATLVCQKMRDATQCM